MIAWDDSYASRMKLIRHVTGDCFSQSPLPPRFASLFGIDKP